MLKEAAVKYWNKIKVNPLTGNFVDHLVESETQTKEAQARKDHGKDHYKRLPISV